MKRLPLYAALLLLTQCSKCKDTPRPKTEEDKLPPITQEGKNTFGCLINGQAYTPQGYNGTSNFAVIYDTGFMGGSLDVRTYRYPGQQPNKSQHLVLGGINIRQVGTYRIGTNYGTRVFFTDDYRTGNCGDYDSNESNISSTGELVITRLDAQAGIIAGTFSATLAQTGCDTVKITQGRFDARF